MCDSVATDVSMLAVLLTSGEVLMTHHMLWCTLRALGQQGKAA
jgi:hypothetical protein